MSRLCNRTLARLGVLALVVLLQACAARTPAPVDTRSPQPQRPTAPPVARNEAPVPGAKPGAPAATNPAPPPAGATAAAGAAVGPDFHVVKRGETLYSIALDNGVS